MTQKGTGGRRFWELTQPQVIPIFLLMQNSRIGQIINFQKLLQNYTFQFQMKEFEDFSKNPT